VNWPYLFLSFDGRIPRQTFWIGFLICTGLEIAGHLLVAPLESGDRLGAIVSLAFTYPAFAVFAKRGHDRNISPRIIGVFFLISVIMDFLTVLGLGGKPEEVNVIVLVILLAWSAFALVLLVELGMRRGTLGPNQYGPDPLT
jgi:uncharacterized membrane protein YhaH (DUF805 family)